MSALVSGAGAKCDPRQDTEPTRQTAAGALINTVDLLVAEVGVVREAVIQLRVRLLGQEPEPANMAPDPTPDGRVTDEPGLRGVGEPKQARGLIEDITREADAARCSLIQASRQLNALLEEL